MTILSDKLQFVANSCSVDRRSEKYIHFETAELE
jgi:hypothetical protein